MCMKMKKKNYLRNEKKNVLIFIKIYVFMTLK